MSEPCISREYSDMKDAASDWQVLYDSASTMEGCERVAVRRRKRTIYLVKVGG